MSRKETGLKTKDYTLRAAAAYRDRHESMTLTLEKGSRERLRSVNITNAEAVKIIMAECERREQLKNIDEDELPEWFNY